MSGFASERNAISTILTAGWSTTTIAWPGVDFSPPAKTGNAAAPAAFLEFRLENMVGERITPAWVRRECAVELRYFEEAAGQGDLLIRQRVDTLMGLFREAHTSTIFFSEPFLEPSSIQFDSEDGWYMAEIRIPYRRFSDVS